MPQLKKTVVFRLQHCEM